MCWKSQKIFKEGLLEPQPALIIPSPALITPLPALIVPSPALITPLPDKPFDNTSPSKEAHKVPNNILRNPPLCSLASC